MNRRTFLASTTAAAGSLTFLRSAPSQAAAPAAAAAALPAGAFKGAKLRLSFPPRCFEGTLDEQLKRIADLGIPGYETLSPPGDPHELRQKADALGVKLSCMVGVGKIAPGGMVNPADHDGLIEDFKKSIETAKVLGCTRLIGLTGNERTDVSRDEQTQYVIQCLKRLAPIAEQKEVTIVIEALNPLVDHKGFFLNRTDHAMTIIEAVDSPNVKMLFDIYHQQITEGNVIRNIRDHIDRIGHFHVADNPGRHEPGTGELNYRNIFAAISETKYDGYVAMEYSPASDKDSAIRAIWECAVGA